jgi:hypothetical protein
MRQLISIHPDGSITGLQFKKRGINLQMFGRAATRRITDIEWNDETQNWQIRFLLGKLAGTLLHPFLAELAELPREFWGTGSVDDAVLRYDDYDLAVKAEIEVIQRLRLKGRGGMVGDANAQS